MAFSTIAAIATPLGSGGIGIIKVSGRKALKIAKVLFRKSAVCTPGGAQCTLDGHNLQFLSHQLYHGHIIDPTSGNVVDEVLLSWMQGPHTYTGEDVMEINTHSGILLMKHIMELVLQQGAELAGPGEFSKRAFLNGRMDLTRAEAVNDLISAETESALKMAGAQLNGALAERIKRLKNALVTLLGENYACLDFGEEIQNNEGMPCAVRRMQTDVLAPLGELIQSFQQLWYLRSGVDVVIAGAPNVGKSTLMNRLAGSERCIVSEHPGTTRDVIEQRLMIQGIAIHLSDTAGLHCSSDDVESIGVEKAWEKIKNADLVLAMVDASRPFNDSDRQLFKCIEGWSIAGLRVTNKIDCEHPSFREKLGEHGKSLPCVEISARYGRNIEVLKKKIIAHLTGGKIIDAAQKIVPNLRQVQGLKKAQRICRRALEAMQKRNWTEIVAEELESALGCLGEITGEVYTEDVIDQIFSRFCIGK